MSSRPMTDEQFITVAAFDSKPEDKEAADFVCDGIHDEVEIQAALDLASATAFIRGEGRPVKLLPGTFDLRSIAERETNTP